MIFGWKRIDRGANQVSHDRMMASLEYFTGNISNGGTILRDLILGYTKDANVITSSLF